MLIFGTRGVKEARANGVFYCPQCETYRNYRLMEQRRYGHVFFIPLIPLDRGEPYVECATCHTTYQPRVLEYDPERQRQQLIEDFNQVLLRSMCLVAAIDGIHSRYETSAIRDMYENATKHSVTDEQVRYLVAIASQDPKSVLQEIQRLAAQLNDRARELLVHLNLLVALSDGLPSDTEFELISAYAQAIGMSQAHFQGVVATVRQRVMGGSNGDSPTGIGHDF